ncbi:MAG TPA: EAL domain-containing protein [Desulfobacteraceae bacterium]|nr:EAL domain-containing protein [Desulfobacteraceae bacterium]
MKHTLKMDLPFIRQWVEKCPPYITGHFNALSLKTALQPIYSLAHKRIVGHEALARVNNANGTPVSPATLFDQDRSATEIIHLDRLCRFIHIHNFQMIDTPINWLFLNVSTTTICTGRDYGSYFKELLEFHEFPAHRIVVEVVEHPIEDNARLLETIAYYKELGCLIAIDDFGAGHSNFDRIWTLQPDIVKLDRSFMVKSGHSARIRHILPGIVTLLHQAGSLVLMEGIETREQAMMAIESDVDFVQGYFFGKPFTTLDTPPADFNGFDSLLADYKTESSLSEAKFRRDIQTYRTLFAGTVNLLKEGAPLDQACSKLLSAREAVRCYRIGTDGIQIGHTLVADDYKAENDKRFRPLEDANSADWFRRHYLKRAIYHPDQLQVTRPYLSIAGAHMCVTLSMKFTCPSGDSVLCCDLEI